MINSEPHSINWSDRFDELDVDQAVDSFTNCLMSVITQHTPNSIIFSLDPSPSLPNWLRYGECGEDPTVRQESNDSTSCHRGKRDG